MSYRPDQVLGCATKFDVMCAENDQDLYAGVINVAAEETTYHPIVLVQADAVLVLATYADDIGEMIPGTYDTNGCCLVRVPNDKVVTVVTEAEAHQIQDAMAADYQLLCNAR